MLASLFWVVAALGQAYPVSLYDGMKWRLVGPFRGGRAESVAGVPGDPSVYYFGAVAGGVWKTTDGGMNWTPIFDREGVSSIGAIAVAPSNPNIVYVGSGEQCLRNDISFGDGVYKSLDGGKTWANIGLRDSQHVATILVNPGNPDLVFVAALGHAFGPNQERGVFRSSDGGKTWKQVLYLDENTGATDLVFDPNDPNTLFAAMYQVRRKAYTMISGGPGSGLYKSTDGGATWKHLEGRGFPGGILGRIGVAVSRANSKRVYAMVEAKENALYRSEDGGQSWQMMNNDPIWVRPWYQNHVFADPNNADTVYLLDLGVFRSTDGGRHFDALPVPHGDNHQLWIDPTNPKRMIEADDGGATITVDGGVTWTLQNNQPTAQFYHVATDNDFNYRIYGSQQDSGSVAIRSRTDEASIGERDWHSVGGGESGFNLPDPRDPEIVYAGDHNGHITRYNGHTGQIQNIAPWLGARAHPPANLKHRFQWTPPMHLSPHDPSVLYLGAEVLFKSTDGGMSWATISPDLTRNDKAKQQSTPEPLTPDNSSAEYYDTIFAISESPIQKDLIWVGTDDGLVHITSDGGKHWSNVTPKQMPEWARVNLIEPSPYEAGVAYVAADLHFSDDFRPMIFKTADFGKTWTQITKNLPANDYVHSVHADPKRKGLLYAGTEMGIYVSFDDGTNWQSLQLNLPHTPVYDTAVHGDDLVVATHGRAFWVLDNISPLRQARPAMESEAAHLYTPTPAYRQRGAGGFGGGAARRDVGQNPPMGAMIDYYLRSAQAEPITLEIADSHGKILHRTASEKREEATAMAGPNPPLASRPNVPLSTRPGMHRFLWNFREDGPSMVPGMAILELQNGGGPLVPPGTYQVKLAVAGKEYTAPLEVKADPRVRASQTDLEKQHEFSVKIRDRITEVHNTVNKIREARSSLENAHNKANSSDLQKLNTVEQKMADIEAQLIQVKSVNRWAALVYPIMLDAQYADLANVVESADAPPPAQTYEVFMDYERRRQDLLVRWQALQVEIMTLRSSGQ
jgi:photosystem II stability/assembly factor-like uncharacterized protein